MKSSHIAWKKSNFHYCWKQSKK